MPKARRVCACAGALCAFALLGGCNMFKGSKDPKEPEPLYGEFHPKGYGSAPAGKATSSKSSDAGKLPPFPPATSTASTAAIAGGDPLMGSRPLGIDDRGGAQPVAAWQGTKQLTSGQSGANVAPPALHPPVVEPLPLDPKAGAAIPGGVPAAPPWTSSAAPRESDPLLLQLAERNATLLRLEPCPAGYKVICSVPRPFQNDVSRTYEKVAPTASAAITAILEEIDRDRRQGWK
jgi:hypothetical protein